MCWCLWQGADHYTRIQWAWRKVTKRGKYKGTTHPQACEDRIHGNLDNFLHRREQKKKKKKIHTGKKFKCNTNETWKQNPSVTSNSCILGNHTRIYSFPPKTWSSLTEPITPKPEIMLTKKLIKTVSFSTTLLLLEGLYTKVQWSCLHFIFSFIIPLFHFFYLQSWPFKDTLCWTSQFHLWTVG